MQSTTGTATKSRLAAVSLFKFYLSFKKLLCHFQDGKDESSDQTWAVWRMFHENHCGRWELGANRVLVEVILYIMAMEMGSGLLLELYEQSSF
jgi:hypothetical protein